VRHQSWSLRELAGALTVIAAVTVLLLPAFGQLLVRPRPLYCPTNMMQLLRAFEMYAYDYDSVLPGSYAYPNTWGQCPMWTWMDLTYPYIRNFLPYACPNAPQLSFVRDGGRLHCPPIASLYGVPLGREPGTTARPWRLGYLYNEGLNDSKYCERCDCAVGLDCYHGVLAYSHFDGSVDDATMDVGVSVLAVEDPANTIALSDGNPNCDKTVVTTNMVTVFRYPRDTDAEYDAKGNYYPGSGCYTTTGEKIGRLDKRHEGGANVGFVDGHVQWLRQTTPNQWTRYLD